MKLLDILARNLSRWPDYAKCKKLRQNELGQLYYNCGTTIYQLPLVVQLAIDYSEDNYVTYDQWLRARNAYLHSKYME